MASQSLKEGGEICVRERPLSHRPAGRNSKPGHEVTAKTQASGLPRAFGFLLVPLFPMMGFAAATEPLRAANRQSGRELGPRRTRARRGFWFFLGKSAGGAREVEEIEQIFEQ